MTYYEGNAILRQYLEFHFGPEYFGVPNYPATCAMICQEALRQRKGRDLSRCTALELGCAVGRAAFELAREMKSVMAIDLSPSFIETAQTLKDAGELAYSIDRQGELTDHRLASLAALGLESARERVEFRVGDACRTPEQGHFDLIFAGNLLDRLESPEAFLRRIPPLLAPGGLLAISSPYTLIESFTPRENWLGGFRHQGQDRLVLDRMKEILGESGLQLLSGPQDVPFVIRETERKFQHTLAELTLWVHC